MNDVHPPMPAVREAVARALAEDLLPMGDITAALIPVDVLVRADVVAREEGVLDRHEGRTLDAQLKLGALNADLRTGLEYWYRNTLALRSGVNGKDLDFGVGVRYKHFGADYAAALHRFFAADDPDFPDDHNLETTHLLSASISW